MYCLTTSPRWTTLTTCLLPKAGYRLVRRRVAENILEEASRWFPREDLLRPLRTWSLPARLRFSYFKWYLLNPQLLVCFFPLSGQETAHHELIIDLLVACAERGMAVWVISSNIDAICEKTEKPGISPAPANHQLTSMENRRQTCGTKTSFFLHPAFFAAGRKASAEFCMARQLPAGVGTCPLAVPRPHAALFMGFIPISDTAEKRLAALRQAGRFSFPSG